jgi:polyisoprenoid-binding protein YceI
MTAHELESLLHSSRSPRAINVLPPEIHAACHIPGSENACVYETTFPEQVRALIPQSSDLLIVYGAGDGSLDAVTAAEKLRGFGYSHVQAFEGGLSEWRTAGLPLDGDGKLPQRAAPDGTFRVNAAQSIIRWTGRNALNFHSGTVGLAAGEIRLRDSELASASFTIDMRTIACEDLVDTALNRMLIAHLHSGDFFDVEQHPTAEFVGCTAERLGTATDGTPNYHLRGTFTLRGISHPLEFPAVIAAAEDGQRITGQGQLEIDRTKYGSLYGSGRFFSFLGKHLVNDHVHLHVKIQAEREG